MNQKQDNLITVLDAGSTKSCVLVAELQDGVLRYRGHGIEPSRGMRKGLIAELGPAAEAINRAALWDPTKHIDRTKLPSYGDMLADQVEGLTREESERQGAEMAKRGMY